MTIDSQNTPEGQRRFPDDLTMPEIKEDDCGEVALRKMSRFISSELEPYVLHNEDEIRERLFRPKEILSVPHNDEIHFRAVVICRVSTCGKLQDPRSPINQAMTMLQIQKQRSDLVIVGVIMDFFKNGAAVEGRMFQDSLIKYLIESADMGFKPAFNCIMMSEFSRMTRSLEDALDLSGKCFYSRIKLFDHNMNVDYALPANRETLVSKGWKAESQISDMGFQIGSAKFNGFLRDRVLDGNHFGFDKKTQYDTSGKRVMYRFWIRKEDEIRIILSAYETFAETASISLVQKTIEERYGKTLLKPFLWKLLTTLKYYGLVDRLPSERTRDPRTKKMTRRKISPLVPNTSDYRKCDNPKNHRYYIKDLDIIPEELFLKVREILERKQRQIKVIPHQTSRAHSPAGENGRTGYTGLLVCASCGAFYKNGAKGFMYCANHRKHRCGQKRGIHISWLDTHFRGLIEQFLIKEMPRFDQAYKYEFSKRIKWLESEVNGLQEKIGNQNKEFLNLCGDVKEAMGSAKERLNNLSQYKAQEIDALEKRLGSLRSQAQFMKSNLSYSLEKAKKWLKNLDELFELKQANRLNEMLRTIISKVELREAAGKEPNSYQIIGKVVFRQAGLARLFQGSLNTTDYYHPIALTEHNRTIVPVCSVNAEIHVNFVLGVIPGQGGRSHTGSSMETALTWKILTAGEVDSHDCEPPKQVQGGSTMEVGDSTSQEETDCYHIIPAGYSEIEYEMNNCITICRNHHFDSEWKKCA
jgi:hypothetical protein